ncbi:MAG: c-type cytochrome [Alphaproteobacteria bacterium]
MKGLSKILPGVLGAFLLVSGGAYAEDAAAEEEFVCDVANGEKIFKRCTTCHTLEESSKRRMQGPTLHGLFGRTSGTVGDFRYSKAMQEAAIVWSQDTLYEYLENPRKYVPRSKMPFRVAKDQERRDVICFLRENTKPADEDGAAADAS